jgi:hypothetical protein
MNLQVSFDYATAAKVAEYFQSAGMAQAAVSMWEGLCVVNPYIRRAREKLGDLYFDQQQSAYPCGSVSRSRFVLQLMSKSFPTQKLRCAYFENIEQLLKARVKRTRPGKVILGIGPGRCGSTTLSAVFGAVPDACSTHENPPLIDWEPQQEQLRFHVDRLRLLADYYALVFDAAHWWLNALGTFFDEFPAGQVIGLHRDTGACVKSFLRVKGSGRGSVNHWAPPENGIWATTLGDPSYPSYPIPSDLLANPDAAKAAQIERYVTEYNQTLALRAKAQPDRMLLLRTEELNDVATATRLGSFVGVSLAMPDTAFNVGSTADSDKHYFRY